MSLSELSCCWRQRRAGSGRRSDGRDERLVFLASCTSKYRGSIEVGHNEKVRGAGGCSLLFAVLLSAGDVIGLVVINHELGLDLRELKVKVRAHLKGKQICVSIV